MYQCEIKMYEALKHEVQTFNIKHIALRYHVPGVTPNGSSNS